VAEDFKAANNKLSVSEKDIKVQSAESGDLENLVEIIKELGERGYFVEEHYLLDLNLNSNYMKRHQNYISQLLHI